MGENNLYLASKDNPLVVIPSGIAQAGKSSAAKILESQIESKYGNNSVTSIEGMDFARERFIPAPVIMKYEKNKTPIPREIYTTHIGEFYREKETLGVIGPYAELVIPLFLSPPPAPVTIYANARSKGDLQRFKSGLLNVLLVGLTADDETVEQRMVNSQNAMDGYGLPEEERRMLARRNIQLEREYFRPEEALDYIRNDHGFVIDTSGQKDTSMLESKISEIVNSIKMQRKKVFFLPSWLWPVHK